VAQHDVDVIDTNSRNSRILLRFGAHPDTTTGTPDLSGSTSATRPPAG